MPYQYTSLFDKSGFITKKEMCALLNLDLKRTNLTFTPQEINKAYRLRALRFYPDKQIVATQPIPENVCNILMSDITRAKEHMLKGEDNIPGKILENSAFVTNKDFGRTLINILKNIKSGAKTVPEMTSWLYLFSSKALFAGLLSTYSNDQLNFRFINQMHDDLKASRPYLQDVDGSTVLALLKELKNVLDQDDNSDAIHNIVKQLREALPELISEERVDELTQEIDSTKNELKKMFTENFMTQLEYILKFWPELLRTVPSWKHIVDVYFFSLFITATSLPKLFNSLKVLTEAVILDKGWLIFALISMPSLLVSAIMLPVNAAVHLSAMFAWIGLKTALLMIKNAVSLLATTINIIAYSLTSRDKLSGELFTLLTYVFDLSVRFVLNLAMDVLDSVFFYATNHYLFSDIQIKMNDLFDKWFNKVEVLSTAAEVSDNQLEVRDGAPEPDVEAQQVPNEQHQFFKPTRIFNEEDVWLEDLLKGLQSNQSLPESAPSL